MTPEEILNSAFNAGNSTQGEGMFILEGDPSRNMFRILPAEQALKDNLNCFVWNINTGFQYLGMFLTEQQAERAILAIRTKLRDEEGNRLI